MLKKLLLYELTVVLILAVALTGCGGGKSNRTSPTPSVDPVVYVGGFYANTNGATACYWDAGGRHDLGDGSSDSNVLWLSFYNDQLYAVGYYSKEGKMVPCYWIDGVRQPFVDPAKVGNNAYVTCGFVYNGKVYAGGWYNDGTKSTPCYWDEGGQHNLSEGQAGEVHSIFVDGSGVYSAGKNASGQACYWDNKGDRHDVSNISGSSATQIVVDTNRVYLSGYNGSGARYWVWVSDGEPVTEHSLNGVEAYSIFVRNNQVYVGGFYSDGGKEIACYWDNNGVRHSLANPDSNYAWVNKIFAYNNKVYAAGTYGNATGYCACYWDDMGGRHDLEVDGSTSEANCILVR